MELVRATEDLRMGGRPYEGFPILLWDSMKSCEPANQFFRYYLLRGAIGSAKSWDCVGRALYDYFSFLQANNLDWRDVDRGERKALVAGYRDYCLSDVKLARNTTRLRLFYICAFYSFALQQAWIDRLPFEYEDRVVADRAVGMLAHLDARGSTVVANNALPKKLKTLPKFLSKDELHRFIVAIENPHHRLMARFGLQTGLRREEIVTFPMAYVLNPSTAGSQRNFRICLDPEDGHGIRTKGQKSRNIYIGRKLMADLYWYAKHLRGERACLSEAKHQALFLNQDGAPFSGGGKQFGRLVTDLGRAIGLHVTTHMLRHTYATHTLVSMQRNRGDTRIEPLVYLQRQLGHSSIQTTMVYLHLVNELADDAVLAYDDEINAMFESAQ